MDNFAAPRQSSLYYKPSGDFTFAGPLLMLAIGAVAAIVLGLAYGYLVQYNPIVYINFLATLGFGAILGVAATIGVRKGKVRAPHIALLDGAIVGAIGVYAAWVVWLHAFFARNGYSFWLISPNDVWLGASEVAKQGAWSIKNATPTGAALYAIWAVEAALIIGICALVCRSNAADPFCESCSEWTAPVFNGVAFANPGNHQSLREQLESGNLNALSQLGAPAPDHFVEASLRECPKCKSVGYLSVSTVSVTQTKKETQTKRKELLKHLSLTGPGLAEARTLPDAAKPAESPATGVSQA